MKKLFFVSLLTATTLFAISTTHAQTLNYYDENGYLIKQVSDDSVIVYENDQQGKQIAQRTYKNEDALLHNNPKETRINNYRTDGKLDTQTAYSGEYIAADNPTPKFIYQYEYDENGVRTAKVQYKNGAVNRYITYERNEGKLRRQTIYQNLDEFTAGNPQYFYQYTYNDHGDTETRKRFEGNDATTPSETITYDYQYDRYGNVIKTYTNGQLSSSNVYDPAYINKLWLANRKLIYTIDEASHVTGTKNRVSIKYR